MPQAGYGPVKRMLVDSVLTIPIGISQLRNITGGRDTAQIRYQKSDSSVYVYTGSSWVRLGTGGGGGGGTADSTVFFTVFRADTMRANIYARIVTTDSGTYFTKYRSDTMRANLYSYIKNVDSLTYFTKYRSDTMRANIYASIPQPDTFFVKYPVRVNNDTIYLAQTFVDSVYNVSSADATRLITNVYNNTGSTINKGSVVYINGRHSSNLPTIALARANDEVNSYKTFALVQDDIPTSSSGVAIQAGRINNLALPTSTYADGDILYLSPTIAGGYTTTKPLAPFHICKIGSVTRAHPTLGAIEIKIENGWELMELSDVSISAVPADSTLLQFSRTDSLWHDKTITQAIGPYFNAKLNITDTANMRVRLSAGTNITSISGTYPNLTINAASQSTDTSSLSNRINLKANTASPTFTGTVTIPILSVTGRSSFTDSLVLTSTVGGITLPNMTQTQMNAIVPRLGTQVYNTTYDAVCTYNNDFGWWSNDQMWMTSNGMMVMEDFITYPNPSTGNGSIFQNNLTSGTVSAVTPISNRPGILQLSTSTSATGRAAIISDGNGVSTLIVGGGKIVFESDVQIPTLSSSAQTFMFSTGFTGSGVTTANNAIYFLYDSAGATTGSAAIGRWQVVCSNSSTRSYTTTDSTVTAGRWYRLRFEVNAAGTSVAFYINGTLVKTETNNIPTGILTPVATILKSNGTTARNAWIDYVRIRQKFTTPR